MNILLKSENISYNAPSNELFNKSKTTEILKIFRLNYLRTKFWESQAHPAAVKLL
jgi:hypothetical protein